MTEHAAAWEERYLDGSPEAERLAIQGFARDMVAIQRKVAKKTGRSGTRTLHAKMVIGVTHARLEIDPSLAPRFAVGYFQPAATYPVTIRFSNASPLHRHDGAADMRGAALRIDLRDGRCHDLLMTSFPVSHARDARQFVEIAKIAAGPKALIVPRLFLRYGRVETRRILGNLRAGMQPVDSLATTRYWSRAPILWGGAGPIRYSLRPTIGPRVAVLDRTDGDFLRRDFDRRLSDGDVTFVLSFQAYVDEQRTPLEDGATEWLEADAPAIDVGRVVIPQRRLDPDTGVDGIAFNPWNGPGDFRPLGSLNRARREVYAASASAWLGHPPDRPTGPSDATRA